MTGKPYSLYTRTRKDNKKVYYARFKQPDGSFGTAQSTGKTSRAAAETWATEQLRAGQIVIHRNTTLADFAGPDFFSWSGPWAENKKAIGKRISERHCRERTDLLRNHILPTLGSYRLTAIDTAVIENYRNRLHHRYAGSTVNKILFSIRTILRAAYRQKLIPVMPEVELVGINAKKRGRLTSDEARRLFSIQWEDQRAFTACLIAATAGLRLSEVQALRIKDIDFENGTVFVRRVWDRRCRIIKEETKGGKERRAPLATQVLEEIQKLLSIIPEGEELLFFSQIPGKPVEETVLIKPFLNALGKIGISEEERRNRGISFHSFRYLANSVLVEAGIPMAKIHESIGHSDESLTERYFRSDDQDDIRQAMEKALFGTKESVLTETVN